MSCSSRLTPSTGQRLSEIPLPASATYGPFQRAANRVAPDSAARPFSGEFDLTPPARAGRRGGVGARRRWREQLQTPGAPAVAFRASDTAVTKAGAA